MDKKIVNAIQPYGLVHPEVEGIEILAELALNLRWSWNHAADTLWQELDSDLWALTRNPWVVLQTVSKDRLEQKIADPDFKKKMDELMKLKEQSVTTPAWFQLNHSDTALSAVAQDRVEVAKDIFNPDTLTLGFARRFVPYKRPTLLLHNPERFIRILTNQDRPVQLVIAGKASPSDESGKALIRQWIQFIQQHNLHHHVIFLSDYDMFLTENIVQGVDVWLNTPRRPWEASGTSGMKVLVNGGINLSERDGWWAEAYTPEVGWALGDGQEYGDDPAWDAAQAEALYDLLEHQVVPEFYTHNESGIPVRWIERMCKSMALLTPRFSANRTVREYTENYYLPLAESYIKRTTEIEVAGKKIVDIKNDLRNRWGQINFGDMQVDPIENGYTFHVPIWLNGIDPEKVFVQLYADGINSEAQEKIKMETDSIVHNGAYKYVAQVETSRAVDDYTARIIPCHEGISAPLENNLILWQR